MSTAPSTIELLLERTAGAGDVTAKKMFGDYGLFLEGRMFAIVGDDQLFIKCTTAGNELYPHGEARSPYPGAKPYLFIPEEKWSDQEWLAELIVETTKLIPLPKKKK